LARCERGSIVKRAATSSVAIAVAQIIAGYGQLRSDVDFVSLSNAMARSADLIALR
jgi:hypothetical protein